MHPAHPPATLLKTGCGIDIAKDKFDCCLSSIDTSQQVRILAQSSFPNTLPGFKALITWAENKRPAGTPLAFLMEATGIYYEQLAWYLHNNDYPLSVVLPNKAKKYKESLGLKSKTDKIDAQALAAMCCERAHTLWEPVSKKIWGLRVLTRQIESLCAAKTVASNQLCALRCGMYRDEAIEQMLERQIALYGQHKKELHTRVEELIDSDPELKSRFEKLLTIKGLGIQTLAVIVAETNGFAGFRSGGQLVSYGGYDVVENQSGNHRGKSRISKKGNAHIRRALFFAAFNMVRYKVGGLDVFYDRIYGRSLIKMKAYVAVQKKLLCLIYALWKKDEVYEEGYKHATLKTTETKAPPAEKEATSSLGTEEVLPDSKKVIPAKKTGITQDRSPQKNRLTPSLGTTKLTKKNQPKTCLL